MDYTLITDLLDHPKVVETHHHLHHHVAKFDHLLRSARYAYRLAPLFGANRRIVVRAAILHDLDSRLGTLRTHGAIAAQVAATLGEPEAVGHAIRSHMYPLVPAPITREGWVLAVADKLASLEDMTVFVGGLFSGASLREQRRLQASDPFYQPRPPRLPRPLRLPRRSWRVSLPTRSWRRTPHRAPMRSSDEPRERSAHEISAKE
jgi:glycyl-tRNA synthetase beta chain/uncharacterized protein